MRRLQEAAAAQAAAHQEAVNGNDASPKSPSNGVQGTTSPPQAAISPISQSQPISTSYLDPALNPVSPMTQTSLPPSRYPIAADGFHSQFPPMTNMQATSYTARMPDQMNGLASRSPPRLDDFSSPSEPFSTYPLFNWSFKSHQALPIPSPTVIPPLSYYYRPHRLEDVAPRDTILLIIALFFDFVYPLTPCVHKPSFMADVHSRREERDPLFFALVMSTVASTLVQVPRSYLPMERHAVRKLAQTCHEASRHISVASYDPPTSMHVVVRYLCVM